MRISKLLRLIVLLSAFSLLSCETPTDHEGRAATEKHASDQVTYVVPADLQSRLADAETALSSVQPVDTSATKDDLLSKIGTASNGLQALDKSIDAAIAVAQTNDIRGDLIEARKSESEASTQLNNAKQKLDAKKKPELSDEERTQIVGYLNAAQKQLTNVQTNLRKAATRLTADPTPPSNKRYTITDWLILAGTVLGAVLLILVLIFSARSLIGKAWATLDDRLASAIRAMVDGVRKHQSDLSTRLNTVQSAQTDIGVRLQEMQLELKSIARLIRDSPPDRTQPRGTEPVSYSLKESRDEPAFPISVANYVENTRQATIVVRPDFQKGILVVDPTNEAELTVVRDSQANGELIMVPRVENFQTRQDFHTYFGKYFECQNPMSGEVWILSPAVVSTVPGGWQLREKGVLEVR